MGNAGQGNKGLFAIAFAVALVVGAGALLMLREPEVPKPSPKAEPTTSPAAKAEAKKPDGDQASLEGRVSLAGGKPLSEASLTLQRATEDGKADPEDPGRRAGTTNDGHYEFERMAPGRYLLTAKAGGTKPAILGPLTLSGGEILELDVSLEPFVLAPGQARGRSETAFTAVDAKTNALLGEVIVDDKKQRDPSGHYRIDYAPGQRGTWVIAPGYAPKKLTGPGELRFDHGVTVTGKIQMPTDQIPPTLVTVGGYLAGLAKPIWTSQVKADYSFELPNMPAGVEFTVVANLRDNFGHALIPAVQLGRTPEPLELRLRNGSRLKAQVNERGKPAKDWAITVLLGQEALQLFKVPPDGHFGTRRLAPLEHRILLQTPYTRVKEPTKRVQVIRYRPTPGQDQTLQDIDVSPGPITLEVTVDKGERRGGLVYLVPGKVDRAEIRRPEEIYDVVPEGPAWSRALADGPMTLTGVLPGSYTLIVVAGTVERAQRGLAVTQIEVAESPAKQTVQTPVVVLDWP